MKKKLFSLLSAILFLSTGLVLSGGCVAIPIDDEAINFQDEVNQLNRQMAVTQQQLAATQQQLAITQQQLNSAQQQLADTQRRLMEAQNQITAAPSNTGADAYYSNSLPSTYYQGIFPYGGGCPYPYNPSPPPRRPGHTGQYYYHGMYVIDLNEIY
jgi:hypothetical protein